MWDLQIHKSEIVQQVSWEQRSPQEVLNSAIEKQKQTIIEWMKKSLSKARVSQEKIQTLKFDVIFGIWIVINSKWDVHSLYKYWKDTWVEYYTSVNWTFTDEDLDYASRDSWYQVRDWKIFRNWQEIPQFLWNGKINPEFVKWVDNVNFYEDIQLVYWLMKTIESWKKLKKFDSKTFDVYIISWVARIKDIMYFAWKWYIPNEDIPKLLKRAVQELPNQCSDTRFYQTAQWIRMWMEVTKDELDQYLKPKQWSPLISQNIYDDCLRRIEVRDRKIQEEQKLKEWTKWEVKIEKARKSFSDRTMEILRWIF